MAWGGRALLGALFLASLGAMAQQMLAGENMVSWELVFSLAITAVPLALIFFAIGLLAEVGEQEFWTHHLTHRAGAALRWTPRIGALVFAAFVGVFALDVFSGEYGFWQTIGAFLIHLIPTFTLLIVAAVAWRWPWVGGVAFLAVAGLFLAQFGAGWGNNWLLYLVFIGPPVVMGLLFLAGWVLRRDLRSDSAATTA